MNEEQPKKIEGGDNRGVPASAGSSAQAGGYSARRFPRKDSSARGPRSAVNRSANRSAYGNRPRQHGEVGANTRHGTTSTPRSPMQGQQFRGPRPMGTPSGTSMRIKHSTGR